MRRHRLTLNLTMEEAEALAQAADRDTRSLSRQAVHYLRSGLGLDPRRAPFEAQPETVPA